MNDAAAPLREEVRSQIVVGTLRGLKSGSEALWAVTNEASQAQSKEKAPTSGSGEGPILTRLANGKIRLDYSVEHHTKYQRSCVFGHKPPTYNKRLRKQLT